MVLWPLTKNVLLNLRDKLFGERGKYSNINPVKQLQSDFNLLVDSCNVMWCKPD